MELPTETLFNILKFLSPKEICAFGQTHSSLWEIVDDQKFWRFYSSERKHPKNKHGLCHKRWAFQMHEKLRVTIFRMGVYSDLEKTVKTHNSISCLVDVLVPLVNFPKHKIFIHKEGRIMKGHERVPKELTRYVKHDSNGHTLMEFHLYAQ